MYNDEDKFYLEASLMTSSAPGNDNGGFRLLRAVGPPDLHCGDKGISRIPGRGAGSGLAAWDIGV